MVGSKIYFYSSYFELVTQAILLHNYRVTVAFLSHFYRVTIELQIRKQNELPTVRVTKRKRYKKRTRYIKRATKKRDTNQK